MRTRWLVSLFLLAMVAVAPAIAAEPKKVVAVEGITEYALDNGVKVLLFPDNSSPKVTVNMTVFVGSRHEGYGETGMAHLLEHMVFKGTPTHAKIPKALQDRGAIFNGTTWLDRTNYYETLPANNDNLEFAIRLEADRLVNSFIKREDLVSEFSVVRSEFERGENNPSGVLMQRMMAASYEWHNYGKSTIGNRSDIERVPIENLQAFYKRFYQPDNVMVTVAGQFDEAKALSYLQKYFGSIPRPKRVLDKTYTEEPAQDGERFVNLRRVGDVGVTGVLYHICAGPHADTPAIQILSRILTQEPSGKLYKALVESKKATSVGGFAFTLHDPGVFMVSADVRRGNSLEEARDIMLEIIEKVGSEGVTEEEVKRAKQQFLNSYEQNLANSQQLAIQLSDWAAQGDWRLYFLHRDRLEKVTPEDVKTAAGKYFLRNNRTVGTFIPTEKPERVAIPSTPDVKTLVGTYQGRKAIAAGEKFDTGALAIEARTKRSQTAEGVKVALLPKKTRGETVSFALTLRYGTTDNLKGLTAAADFLPTLMLRGTKKRSYQQLKDELDKNKGQIRASGDTGEASFFFQTKRENLPAVLGILSEVLREPSLPAKELEVLRRQTLANYEEQRSEPGVLAGLLLRRTTNPYPKDDIRYIPTIDESIERIQNVTIEQIQKLYNEYLGAQAGELTIVGDFDPAEAMKILNKAFSGWTATKPYARIEQIAFPNIKAGKESLTTPDKANATYMAGFVLPISDTHADYPALVMGNYILGAGTLSSRLGDRIRQKEGLSYGVRSTFAAAARDQRGSLTINAICNPANMEKVEKAVAEEVALLLAKGVTEEELSKAKEGYVKQMDVMRANDFAIVMLLNSTTEEGKTMAYYADLEKKIKALTTAQVQAALKKHIHPQKFVIVTAGDFAKKSAGGSGR